MDAELRCRCGEVHGHVKNASSKTGNRIACYCDDCQAFAHHLHRADVLDAHGGTDIVQVAPASLSFARGVDRIAGLRLAPKGLYRWYASCCNTPLGNMLSPAVPFIGIAAQAFDVDAQTADGVFGKPVGAILGTYAIGEPPPGSTRLNPWFILGVIRTILGWRLRGLGWPHPFFDRATRAAIYPITVLTYEQREALRPLCGPKASAST